MKKWLAIVLCFAMLFTFVACDKGGEEPKTTDTTQGADQTKPEEDPNAKLPDLSEEEDSGLAPVSIDQIKVGFVHISDPSDQGYTYNHNLGTEKMKKELGLRDDQIINKFNIPESSECESAIRELVEQGCHIIFATSFGHENFMLKVAEEYPDVEFCHATGTQAAGSGLKNMHNYFGRIYQARYLSGIAAGLKTENNTLGYVCAMAFPECISGFDAFYLGAKSVNPDVKMKVMYTNSWNDPTKEAQVAQALIDAGCDVIGQHCDSTAPATTAEKNKVFHVGYNSDMIEAAPKASLTSAVWDWSIYLEYAVNHRAQGKKIAPDWSQGLSEGAVNISALNEAIIADGTVEAIEAAREKILGGWDVFEGPLKNNQGEIVVEEGVTYQDSRSAPEFEEILEGIEIIG